MPQRDRWNTIMRLTRQSLSDKPNLGDRIFGRAYHLYSECLSLVQRLFLVPPRQPIASTGTPRFAAIAPCTHDHRTSDPDRAKSDVTPRCQRDQDHIREHRLMYPRSTFYSRIHAVATERKRRTPKHRNKAPDKKSEQGNSFHDTSTFFIPPVL